MPILIAILTALAGAIWWWVRRNPREAFHAAQDAATTLRNAPRRLAFRRQTNQHPVEGIDDPRIAICAIAQAFIEMDALPTAEQRDRLLELLTDRLQCTPEEAREMAILGRWLITQCPSPQQAVPRLGRRLFKLDGTSWDSLQGILENLAGDDLSTAQVSAIGDLRVAFRR